MNNDRRKFVKQLSLSASGTAMMASFPVLSFGSTDTDRGVNTQSVGEKAMSQSSSNEFQLSLAQWSLHRSFFGETMKKGWGHFAKTLRENPDQLLQGELDPFDFPSISLNKYGIDCIELVNTFYFTKANDDAYWDSYKQQCDSLGVKVNLIMCDALGNIGDANEQLRDETVKRHHAWVDIAAKLGAHAIRVNAAGQGSMEELAANAVDGLSKLSEYGESKGISILVENHGGFSSNGEWLAGIMTALDNPNCGTLPDFGNFCIKRTATGCTEEYDRYKGIEELMPFAKGVSAKSHDFDENGFEKHTDFMRVMTMVKDAGYKGYVGIEYEGNTLSEDAGIKATQQLLNRCFATV